MAFEFNNLLAVGAEIEQRAAAVPKKWAGKVVEHGRENAPVRTGFLRDHIVDTSQGDEGDAESQADYSADVNFGTIHMHAQPYFSQAIEQANGELEAVVGEAFGGLGGGGGIV